MSFQNLIEDIEESPDRVTFEQGTWLCTAVLLRRNTINDAFQFGKTKIPGDYFQCSKKSPLPPQMKDLQGIDAIWTSFITELCLIASKYPTPCCFPCCLCSFICYNPRLWCAIASSKKMMQDFAVKHQATFQPWGWSVSYFDHSGYFYRVHERFYAYVFGVKLERASSSQVNEFGNAAMSPPQAVPVMVIEDRSGEVVNGEQRAHDGKQYSNVGV